MSSTVIAGPPGECCAKHVKHSGEPVGKTVEIGGVPTYVSEPASVKNGEKPTKIILFYADILGPLFLNCQLIQDFYADNGYLVLGIDYFFGDSIAFHQGEEGFEIVPWALGHKKHADEIAPGWLKGVKEIYGMDAKYYAVGYCFGAPFILDLAATDKVSAAAFAHPSLINESHFQNLTQPLLMLCAEDDYRFDGEGRKKAGDILAAKKATYLLQLFSGVSHGFATKADLSIENQRWVKEESADAVVRWFNRF